MALAMACMLSVVSVLSFQNTGSDGSSNSNMNAWVGYYPITDAEQLSWIGDGDVHDVAPIGSEPGNFEWGLGDKYVLMADIYMNSSDEDTQNYLATRGYKVNVITDTSVAGKITFTFKDASGNDIASNGAIAVWLGNTCLVTSDSGERTVTFSNYDSTKLYVMSAGGSISGENSSYLSLSLAIPVGYAGGTVTKYSNGNLTPIGWDTETNTAAAFTGTFDGNGHAISGLEISVYASEVDGYAGLFCKIQESAVVQDLSLLNGVVTANGYGEKQTLYAGGVAAYSLPTVSTKVSRCSNEMTISTAGTLINKKTTQYTYSGGLIGFSGSDIERCHNSGIVNAVSTVPPGGYAYAYAGGIVARDSGHDLISETYNEGSVSAYGLCGSTAESNVYVGGISGNFGVIYNCYNTGTMYASSSSSNPKYVRMGGIMGQGLNTPIINCYSVGTMSYDFGGVGFKRDFDGGIVGDQNAWNMKIYNSYTNYAKLYGDIRSASTPPVVDPGTHSAYDGKEWSDNDVWWTGVKTDVAMMSRDTYYSGTTTDGANIIPGWDFDTIWMIEEGAGYPTFIPEAAIMFDPNGGSGHMEKLWGVPGTQQTMYEFGYVLSGYHLVRWNTMPNGSGIDYPIDGGTFTMPDADTYLYAIWAKNVAPVIMFDPNGGSGEMLSMSAFGGTTQTMPASEFSKAGYHQVGWNTNADGSGTSYPMTGTFTMPSANVTVLYAQWIVNDNVTITFNVNEGNGTMGNFAAPAGSTQTMPASQFAMIGYHQTGWNTNADGSGTAYAMTGSFVMPDSNITLYAMWTVNDDATITFNANGGTGMMDMFTAPGLSRQMMPASQFAMVGYHQTGWNTRSDGMGVSYGLDLEFSMPLSDVTLYAQWAVNDDVTITFNANGGTGTMDSFTAPAGSEQTIPTSEFFKAGFHQIGWNEAADGSGTAYAMSGTFTMPVSSVTLYAQWTVNDNVTITFDANEGVGTMDGLTAPAGSTQTMPESQFTRAGFHQTGWNTTADGSGTAYAMSGEVIMPDPSVTLYAQWTVNDNVTITFNANEGSGTMDELSAPIRSTQAMPASEFSRAGYHQTGWNEAADGSGVAYPMTGSITMPAAAVTLFAQWTVNDDVTVTFDANDGIGIMGNLVAPAGSTQTIPASEFSKAGYHQTGWNAMPDGSGVAYALSGNIVMPDSSITLYALWTVNDNVTVTFDANEGAGTMDALVAPAGSTQTIPASEFSRAGYHQTGWNAMPDGSGSTYALESIIIPNEDMVLYAQWIVNDDVTITFSANGGIGTMDRLVAPAGSIQMPLINRFTLAGHHQSGWNTMPDGSGVAYALSESIVMPDSDTTLYAMWDPNDEVTASFIGGIDATGTAPGPQTVFSGQTVILPENTFARDGYEFAGWSDGMSTYQPGHTYLMTDSVEFTAQWTATRGTTYSVDVSVVGKGGTADIYSVVPHGTNVIIPTGYVIGPLSRVSAPHADTYDGDDVVIIIVSMKGYTIHSVIDNDSESIVINNGDGTWTYIISGIDSDHVVQVFFDKATGWFSLWFLYAAMLIVFVCAVALWYTNRDDEETAE